MLGMLWCLPQAVLLFTGAVRANPDSLVVGVIIGASLVWIATYYDATRLGLTRPVLAAFASAAFPILGWAAYAIRKDQASARRLS